MSGINVKPTGPRLTKKARERQNEDRKADKALGGAVLKSTTVTAAKQHWAVELQWFRLLRGQARLNQVARILVELSPDKVFDPREIYAQHLKTEIKESSKVKSKDEAAAEAKADKKSGKGGGAKKEKKMSKKDQIIAANKAKLQKDAVKLDQEKLRTLGKKAGANVKLKTENGRVLLLFQILKSALAQRNTVDILDTLWEIESVCHEIDDDQAAALVKQFSSEISAAKAYRTDKKALGKKNLIDFQLTEMSDRLPPLNLHSLSGKFKLDDWQLHVIKLVEAHKSVLISAPTSSGKTVLSTFVCTAGGRVMFVVPTEPLAWQVAAMLRALKLDIALVVPTLTYVPATFDVVIGTPLALESALTKQIGFDFKYAVFDEVHSLNNDCGPAMQRLIRMMPDSCRFLALSATIGNVHELKRWWEDIVGEGGIECVVHSSRFINLQRHVWTNPSPLGAHSGPGLDKSKPQGTGNLQFLHPCSALSMEMLLEHGFEGTDLAFTPVDTYRLYEKMRKKLKAQEVPVLKLKSIRPDKFFSTEEGDRITLAQAKEYEDLMKLRLVELAKKAPELTAQVLEELAPALAPTTAVATDEEQDALTAGIAAVAVTPATDAASPPAVPGSAVDHVLGVSERSTSMGSLTNLLFDLKGKELTPAISFQLDSVWCQGLYDGLLRELETRERAAFPEYREGLEKEHARTEKLKLKAAAAGSKKTGGSKADVDDVKDVAGDQEFGAGAGSSVDVNEPHPEFVLTPPGRGMGAIEADDVQYTLKDDLPADGDLAHPLIRGLRRGIGLYVTGLPSAYHRIVQSFAQRGRLGVVFSDELLAYGVNMPFRTTVFFGDPGKEWLTPLMHQQMAGRAGRRGLDRRGHLVYAGFSPDRLRGLLRGELPAVKGRFPLYPTIPLQMVMNERWEVTGEPLTLERMTQICSTPLAEFLKGEKVENYFGMAEQWIDRLGVLSHPETPWVELIPELVWELREFLPESLAVEYCLEHIIKRYMGHDVVRGDADSAAQMSMFLLFSRICSRAPALSDAAREALRVYWVGALPAPNKPDEEWEEWSTHIKASQQRILDITDLPYQQQLLLPVGVDEPLDNQCYASFVRNQIDPELPTAAQHYLRQRLWNIGEVLRICSNVLGRSPDLAPVQNLIRKSFVRVRYILDETFQRNWGPSV